MLGIFFIKFKIVLSVDGSGRGAAVVAAVEAEKNALFKFSPH